MTAETEIPDPQHRNWLWRLLQVSLQIFLGVWLRYRASGMERLPDDGALLLINHQSFLDPVLVGLPLKRPVSFLARDNLLRIPVIGWILRNTHVMAIRRESAGTESLKKSIARLEQGFYVGLFPEGTRSHDGKIGIVKPGFVAIARRAAVPIVPVGIAGAYDALPRNSKILRPTAVRVIFGEPIPVETVTELSMKGREEEFTKLIRERLNLCWQAAEEWRNGNATFDASRMSN